MIELLQKVDQLMTSNKERIMQRTFECSDQIHTHFNWKKVLDKCLCANFAICHIVGSTVGFV